MTQLCMDFDQACQKPAARPLPVARARRKTTRQIRGRTSYDGGRLAELNVADHYAASGYKLMASRWRGKAGEIDMILKKGPVFVFVEVKSSKDFARAAERISRRQMDRICRAATEYCSRLPTGQMTEMRMDAALVDQAGRVQVLEGAFGAD